MTTTEARGNPWRIVTFFVVAGVIAFTAGYIGAALFAETHDTVTEIPDFARLSTLHYDGTNIALHGEWWVEFDASLDLGMPHSGKLKGTRVREFRGRPLWWCRQVDGQWIVVGNGWLARSLKPMPPGFGGNDNEEPNSAVPCKTKAALCFLATHKE